MPPVTVPPPAPRSKTEHGVTYFVHELPPTAALVTSGDPRVVTLVALQERDDRQPACGQVSPSARLVRENARAVVVATFGYTTPERSRVHSSACLYISTSVGKQPAPIGYARLRVRLHAPLGHRRLVDAETGDLIGVLSAAPVPAPHYLPHGYRPTLTRGYTPGSSYLSIRQFEKGSRTIEIRGRSATAWGLNGHVVSRLSVHGHDAVVVNESYEHCVVWTDPPGVLREVCSLAPKEDFLKADTLTKIADSLR